MCRQRNLWGRVESLVQSAAWAGELGLDLALVEHEVALGGFSARSGS